VIACATFIPVAKRLPFGAIGTRPKDIPFARQDKIGTSGKRKIDQTRFQKIDRATGIDGPDGTGRLQLADQIDAWRIQNGFAHPRHDCAVKICAEKTYSSGHGTG
jgi:hypothetical protein